MFSTGWNAIAVLILLLPVISFRLPIIDHNKH